MIHCDKHIVNCIASKAPSRAKYTEALCGVIDTRASRQIQVKQYVAALHVQTIP